MPRRLTLLLLLLPLALAGCALPAAAPSDAPAAGAAAAPTVTFQAVRFETSHGDFTAILFPDQTPETFSFFTGLVAQGYYDGREFNRVIPGFVIQEVDRAGGATDQPENVVAEFGTDVMFSAGALGIARSEDPDSGGSEFFVMDFAHSHLYGNYTAFGQVVEGLDVVRAIARVETVDTGGVFVPGVPVGVHDRVAIEPGRILSASVVDVQLPADVAARYPLVVGETTRTESARYTLEWPRDLRASVDAALTWYVYTSGEAPAGVDGYGVLVDGPGGQFELPTAGDPSDARIRHVAWPAPDLAGDYAVSLLDGERVLATTNVTVRA